MYSGAVGLLNRCLYVCVCVCVCVCDLLALSTFYSLFVFTFTRAGYFGAHNLRYSFYGFF
jgi:hypothetical protein